MFALSGDVAALSVPKQVFRTPCTACVVEGRWQTWWCEYSWRGRACPAAKNLIGRAPPSQALLTANLAEQTGIAVSDVSIVVNFVVQATLHMDVQGGEVDTPEAMVSCGVPLSRATHG